MNDIETIENCINLIKNDLCQLLRDYAKKEIKDSFSQGLIQGEAQGLKSAFYRLDKLLINEKARRLKKAIYELPNILLNKKEAN